MGSFYKALKNDIFSPTKLDRITLLQNVRIASVFYLLATPMGLMACYSSIMMAFNSIKNPADFLTDNLWQALAQALVFGFKLPYSMDKPIAVVAFSLNFIGWLIATIMFSIAYFKHSSSDENDKNSKNSKNN